MRTLLTVSLLMMTVALGSTAVAVASDFCVDIGFGATHLGTLVGKAFALPGRGACRDFRGYSHEGLPLWIPGTVLFVGGHACGSSDGDHVTFSLFGSVDGSAEVYSFSLNRGTLAGQGNTCNPNQGSFSGTCSIWNFTKIPCSPSTVPVP
jgi:hypothetical protein